MCQLIHISNGNSKTGAIPSFSLPSGITCSKEACVTCYVQNCYAHKIERLRPNVHQTYMDNYEVATENLPYLEQYLRTYFSAPNAPRLFRIHVSGDFFSDAYLRMWLSVIRDFPQTQFLAFTKQVDIVRPYVENGIPSNFSLILSAWPGIPLDETCAKYLPVAWVDDGKEDRIPEKAIRCPGHCEDCAYCWALCGQDVVFKKH